MNETIILALKLHIKNKVEMSVKNQKTILKYINNKGKEIKILNNVIKILLKENENKEKVILKYDNIIKELEKWLEAHLDEEFYWFKMYDKLQELKGDSSNE